MIGRNIGERGWHGRLEGHAGKLAGRLGYDKSFFVKVHGGLARERDEMLVGGLFAFRAK